MSPIFTIHLYEGVFALAVAVSTINRMRAMPFN